MEHYKSTFATIGAAVTGLVLAAQIMQTGPFSRDVPPVERVRPAAEALSDDVAWVNPPARLPKADPDSDAREARTEAPARMALDAPVPPVQASLQAQASSQVTEPAARPPAPRKAASAHRRKVVQRAARTRQAVLETRAAPEAAAPQGTPAQAQPAAANRIDPIGDLIRGLGFGGDRQG